MTNTHQISNVIFILILLAFILICFFKPGALENWETYKQKPYGYVKSGASPLNFYHRPKYRKPYRYPLKFRQSYPYDHMTHLS